MYLNRKITKVKPYNTFWVPASAGKTEREKRVLSQSPQRICDLRYFKSRECRKSPDKSGCTERTGRAGGAGRAGSAERAGGRRQEAAEERLGRGEMQ